MDETLIDTGLTAPVTNQAPAPFVPAPIPVPSTQMPDGWSIHRVAALVRELAMNLYDVPVILKKHNLSEAQYTLLTENPLFQRTLEAATIEWNAPQSTNKRLALEAAIALEDALPTVASRLSKATEPLPGVVELAKLLAKVAGIGEGPQQQGGGERFKIIINLGADTLNIEKFRPAITLEHADAPAEAAVAG